LSCTLSLPQFFGRKGEGERKYGVVRFAKTAHTRKKNEGREREREGQSIGGWNGRWDGGREQEKAKGEGGDARGTEKNKAKTSVC